MVERIPSGVAPGRLAATDDSLWITDETLSTVGELDLTSEAISSVQVGNGPSAVRRDRG